MPEPPRIIRVVGDTLLMEAQVPFTNAPAKPTGPDVDLLALPTTGGAVRTIGVLPEGKLQASTDTAFFVTEIGGDVYSLKPDSGPQHVANHVVDEADGLAIIDASLLIVGRTGVLPIWKRVDLHTGDVSVMAGNPRLPATDIRTAGRGDSVYMASSFDGTTLRIAKDGTATGVPAPKGFVDCLAITDSHLWWFERPEAESVPKLFVAPTSGGAPAAITETRAKDDISACAATKDHLIYINGRTIYARDSDGKVTPLARTHGFVTALEVSGGAIYWGEELSDHTGSIRTLPLPPQI